MVFAISTGHHKLGQVNAHRTAVVARITAIKLLQSITYNNRARTKVWGKAEKTSDPTYKQDCHSTAKFKILE